MGGPESGQAGDAALSHTPHVPSAVKTLEGPVPSRSLKEPTHRFKNGSGESVVKAPGFLYYLSQRHSL